MKYVSAHLVHSPNRVYTWLADDLLVIRKDDIFVAEYGYRPEFLRVVSVSNKPPRGWNGPWKVVSRLATPDETRLLTEYAEAVKNVNELFNTLPRASHTVAREKKRRVWTEEEDKVVVLERPIPELARKLGRTVAAVNSRRYTLRKLR